MSDKMTSGVGVSMAQGAAEAGTEAAREAVSFLAGEPPALVLVFTTPRYDLPELLKGIRSVTGGALLVGATGSGEIVRGTYLGFGAGVGVLAMSAGGYRFGAASADHIRGNLDQAGQAIARESRAAAGASPFGAVLLLVDSLAGDLQQVITGVYRITGPKIPITGGAAGDEQKFIRTFVFHNDRVVEEGAVALWIGSDHPLTVVTGHGWRPIGVPLLVTRVEGTEIIEIGGRPASVVYEETLGIEDGQLSADKFWGTSILHPLGLLQSDGSSVIRVARSKTDQGGLRIQGCVPPAGSAVQVMSGNADTLLGIVGGIARQALDAQRTPKVLLTFSCAARANIFGQRAPEEARTLQATAGDVPTFGFYCCGEFARSAGVLGTHNATLTALAL
ncbi:MAG TPA: FIST N-terminal domain-containing protein [Spirochaetia bacterium]|nr:FIST N-terminal domain-containing protein [Spirochaetia bacterium]